jgi:hypothetical protein
LDLIDDHQTGQLLECGHRRRQAPHVNRTLEIEELRRLALRNLSRKRCLAALTGAKERSDRIRLKRRGHLIERVWSRQHKTI